MLRNPVSTPQQAHSCNDRKTIRSLTVPGLGPNVAKIGRLIPAPDISIEPVLSLGAFMPTAATRFNSVLDAGPVVKVTAGRYAIAWAIKLLGLQKGDGVLMPAFHCASMIEPLSVVGAEPVFYRINDDLTIDLDDVRSKLTPSVKAILATHYFGFPQPLAALREFCDGAGIALIEDCAHSFFGNFAGRPVGSYGDFAIASPRKFFPVPDGGILVRRSENTSTISLSSADFPSAAKQAFNFLEHSLAYGRLFAIAPIINLIGYLGRAARGSQKNVGLDKIEPILVGGDSGAFGDFDAALMLKKMS